MKLKCLGCDALARLIYAGAASSPHVVDIELFQLGLHRDPADLRQRLQASIDAVDSSRYDAIVLAYGLCGKSTAGLIARNVPMAIPRAHDCITLFLGSRERYTAEFEKTPGTYWYVQDYLERNDMPGTALSIGADSTVDLNGVYDEYVEKYGKANAEYLMEVMGAWQQHYQRAAYIDLNLAPSLREASLLAEQQARDGAGRRGWTFECLAGDQRLIQKLLHAEWDDEVLVLEPGQQIDMTYDEAVIGCRPSDGRADR